MVDLFSELDVIPNTNRNPNVYIEHDIDGYERVVECLNESVGLHAFVAIHNTHLGPGLGGCRMWSYKSKQEALTDVLRLSKGMTYKNALAGIGYGGAKSVIIGNSKTDKTSQLLQAMGDFVDYLGGSYIIAEDVGISVNDMVEVRKNTNFVVSENAPDPGTYTADGVYRGIISTIDYRYGLYNKFIFRRIAVQGVGSVGSNLIRLLYESDRNFEIYASDINDEALKKMVNTYGVIPVSQDEIMTLDCHVFAPCALGGILNEKTIPNLGCDIVAGSANNQLFDEDTDGILLDEYDILYAPDYVINAGGVMMVAGDREDGSFNEMEVYKKIKKIPGTLELIYNQSLDSELPTNKIANILAETMFEVNDAISKLIVDKKINE